MKKTSFFRSLLLLGASLVGLASTTGCNNPEDFCAGWVADQCEVLQGCCKTGAKFDMEGCIVGLSDQCQDFVEVEQVHAGDVVFDSGAASTCLGTVETCDPADATAEEAFDRQVACANVLTGFRPQGAACSQDEECESNGEFSQCWEGSGNDGVCAAVELTSDATCGFTIETNELVVCNVEEYCDTSAFTPNASDPPSKRALEFKGKCKPYLGSGGVCFDPMGTNPQVLPCKEGLFCDTSNGMSGICTTQKGEGEACQGGNECKSPLACDFNGMDQVCTKGEVNGPFCFTPPVCGDMMCDFTTEMTTCPQDCGGGPDCGDGTCDFNNDEPATCPIDCCGDGFCDSGEDAVCPADCGGGI